MALWVHHQSPEGINKLQDRGFIMTSTFKSGVWTRSAKVRGPQHKRGKVMAQKRKLAAILSVDAVGYSRLMAAE